LVANGGYQTRGLFELLFKALAILIAVHPILRLYKTALLVICSESALDPCLWLSSLRIQLWSKLNLGSRHRASKGPATRSEKPTLNRLSELFEQLDRIRLDRATNCEELNNIDASFAALVFSYERLRLSEAFCQIRLGQSGFAAWSGPSAVPSNSIARANCEIR
jgi:hypothetical protein